MSLSFFALFGVLSRPCFYVPLHLRKERDDMGFHGKQRKFSDQKGEYVVFAGAENQHLVVVRLSIGGNMAITGA